MTNVVTCVTHYVTQASHRAPSQISDWNSSWLHLLAVLLSQARFEMDSNDLFSFLDQEPEDVDNNDDSMDADAHVEVPKKRKVNVEETKSSPVNTAQQNGDGEAGPSVSKKARIEPPSEPLVVDDVEIEAKREVAASAGLQGGVEAGAKLELRHQVSLHFYYSLCTMLKLTRCDTKLRFHLVTLTFPYLNMYLQRNQHANISSLWILSNKFQSMRYNVTRACLSLRTRVLVKPS